MPTNAAYHDAMQKSLYRLKIPALRAGAVEMTEFGTNAGKRQDPWASNGTFAIVYKFRLPDGSWRALRCFKTFPNSETQMRYEQISHYFQQHIPTITAGFRYHTEGILVKEDKAPDKVYPLIEMDWIEGKTLLKTVDELCSQCNCVGLKNLSQQWLVMIQQLHHANIAHGDLAGDNVIVRNDGQMILVDYDGVYVPSLSGLHPVVHGKSDYQHPQKEQRGFHERMDDFSALLIYTALLALSIQPQLWNTYVLHDSNGKLISEYLLFEQKDLLDPMHSPLLHALEQFAHPFLSYVAQALKQMCIQPVEQVRFPTLLFNVTAIEKQRDLADRFLHAYQRHDTEAMLALCAEMHDCAAPIPYVFIQQQQHMLEQQAHTNVRTVLDRKIFKDIAKIYVTLPDGSTVLTQEEHERIDIACRFVAAFERDDDNAIISAVIRMQKSSYQDFFVFTAVEQCRIMLAQQRTQALARFRLARVSKKPRQIADAYTPLLDAYLTPEGRRMVELVNAYVYANNPDMLISAYDAIQQSPHRYVFIFTAEEQQRIEQARRSTHITVFQPDG